MSYDISVHQLGSANAQDPAPLGPRAEVIGAIESTFPGVTWVDPNWGHFADGRGSAEFSMGVDDPLTSFAVHLRGDFHVLIERIEEACAQRGWEVFDWQGEPWAPGLSGATGTSPELAKAFAEFFGQQPAEVQVKFYTQVLDARESGGSWKYWQEQLLAPFFVAQGAEPLSIKEFCIAVGWDEPV